MRLEQAEAKTPRKHIGFVKAQQRLSEWQAPEKNRRHNLSNWQYQQCQSGSKIRIWIRIACGSIVCASRTRFSLKYLCRPVKIALEKSNQSWPLRLSKQLNCSCWGVCSKPCSSGRWSWKMNGKIIFELWNQAAKNPLKIVHRYESYQGKRQQVRKLDDSIQALVTQLTQQAEQPWYTKANLTKRKTLHCMDLAKLVDRWTSYWCPAERITTVIGWARTACPFWCGSHEHELEQALHQAVNVENQTRFAAITVLNWTH